MKRRDFLLYSSLLPFSGLISPAANANISSRRILILLELSGGNDGLNTLIPYTNSRYYEARPNVAIPRNQIIPLKNDMGMHPALKPLLSYWNKKQLAWVQNIGYPNASRSHFRSINVWETAKISGKKSQQGWLDNYASNQARHIDGIILDDNAGALMGDHLRTLNIENPETFLQQAKLIRTRQQTTNNQALAYILEQQQHLNTASSIIANKLQRENRINTQAFPSHKFGQQMKHAARLISSGVDVPIYKVGLGSFDTHAHQQSQHSSLLNELATGLASFAQAMESINKWNDVLIMSYSEFGRRVAENGARGTDHGAASCQFVLGGKVRGDLYGKNPNLNDLDKGDLKYDIDFRSLYATIAQKWLAQSPRTLAGFKPLRFV